MKLPYLSGLSQVKIQIAPISEYTATDATLSCLGSLLTSHLER